MLNRLAVPALLGLVVLAAGATHDNTVEWNGVSHIDWLDRTPLCPIDGESFTVAFQTYHYDLTAARVYVNAGTPVWIDAHFNQRRGPYDVWTAVLPATSPTALVEYYIELTDGTDTDYVGPGGVSDNPPASGWWLDMATASHAPVGATLTSDGGAVFKVWAPPPSWYPSGDWISVRGDFNGWSCTPLVHDGDYYWYGRVPGAGPGQPRVVEAGDNYKFYFWDSACGGNGWDYHEDARYRYVNRSNFNNSVVIDPHAYAWTHKHFTPPPFEEMVVYELHVGTFSGRNDGLNRMGRYRDIVDQHVDHLLYLGVNVVELMPINEFDGYESWGYNPVNNWAPEESYGSPDDLKYTIDKLHAAGIAVTLDIVYNHFSSGGNYLWEYGDYTYFDRVGSSPGCDTPWGAQAALWRQEVQDYYADNVLYWLEEFGLDGFRMDATRYMRSGYDNWGCYPAGADLMKRINANIDRRKIDAISIAEELPNSTWVVQARPAGAGFDAQWHDAYNDDVRAAVFAAARGQNPNMGAVAGAIIASGYASAQLVRYVESHDEAGGDGSGDDDRRLAVSIDPSSPYSFKAQSLTKLAQGLTIHAPGIPMFLQGGEWAEDAKFDAGWNNRIDWSKAVTRPEMTLFFRDAIGVRKSTCSCRADAANYVSVTDDTNNVVAFTRGTGYPHDVLVIVNFSNQNLTNYPMPFPDNGTWYEVLNSQATVYGGNGWGNGGQVSVSGYAANITIPQWSILVLRHEDPLGRSSDLDGDGDVDLRDYATLQDAAGRQGCGMWVDVRENGRVDFDDFAELAQYLGGPN